MQKNSLATISQGILRNNLSYALLTFACLIITFFTTAQFAFATEYSSASFQVLDPVLFPAGYSSSLSFSLTSTIGQIAIGTSTVASSSVRELRSGFEYFPFVNSPVLSGIPGDTQATLNWTPSSAVLGWVVSGYKVGQSTTPSGPYTYSSLGLVTTQSVSGLTNGATYYFVVSPLDAFGNTIATSSEVTVVPTGSIVPPPPPSGGGGGTSPPSVSEAAGTLHFQGKAYPSATVALLRDGEIIKKITANDFGDFFTDLTLPAQQNYQFGFTATDQLKRTSNLLTISSAVRANVTTNITGLFIPPTLDVDKQSVQRGDSLGISGFTYKNALITLLVSEDPLFVKNVHSVQIPTSATGWYTYRFTVGDDFTDGTYVVKARATIHGESSIFSAPVVFVVSHDGSQKRIQRECRLGDLNDDGHVDIVDFSIAVYWYNKPLLSPFQEKEAACLNADKQINLLDFSLMAYYWTG